MPLGKLDIQTVEEINIVLNAAKNGTLDAGRAVSASHAGVDFVKTEDIYPQPYRDATVSGSAGDVFTFTKNAEAGSYTWYAVKIAIRYETIADLNRDFYLGYELVSGQEATTLNIVDGQNDDWNPNNNPVNFGSIGAEPYNIYDAIIASGHQAVYEAQKILYINLAYFHPDNTVPPATASVWNIKPRFLLNNSSVIASELSPVLIADIDAKVANSALGVTVPKQPYESDGVGNGDNANSVMVVTDHIIDGTVYGYKTYLKYSGTSYLYSWHKVSSNYADVVNKVFKLVLQSDTVANFQFRMLAGGSWYNGVAKYVTVNLNASNNYTQVVELDMAEQAIADFYAIADKPQSVVFALVWEGSSDRHPINLYSYYYDQSDELTLAKDAESKFAPLSSLEMARIKSSMAGVEQIAQAAALSVADFATDKIVCWGDSLTAGGGWTTTLATLSGLPVYNGGTGGESSQTIMARQGGDVMQVNNITIPAAATPVLIADRDVDVGIDTYFGKKVTPLLQGGAHVNPVMIGDIEGTLSWTGSSYNDMTGDWTFTRSVTGSEVQINRPTAIRTNFDRNYNNGVLVLFIGQNGGYTDINDLIWQHKRMIEHSSAKDYIVLGLSSGSEASRSAYETAMSNEFGRNFLSLREYLSAPVYDVDGITIISSYGLVDAGLTATQADLDAIATGTVPPQLLADAVHYTTATKTVIGNIVYKRMNELNFFN